MKDKLLEKIVSYVEKSRDLIFRVERHIWENPEIGYKEWKTTEFLQKIFEELGYKVEPAGDIPGFIAQIDTGKPGPCVAIVAELDSLLCPEHPEANPRTGAVHACGHHCQSAYLVGCASAFAQPGALDGLCGSIRFMGVPAEETIDLEYRNSLIEQGKIHYVAGKVEFLYRGLFDGVDLVLFAHALNNEKRLFAIDEGSDGCITKHFEFVGKSAHAGCAPHEGINSLYAATVAFTACNAMRETFEEKDYVRFHPIITNGGVAANAIPGVTKLDTYVRASTFDVMIKINKKMNRAISAAAASMGANALIHDIPGNMPLINDKQLSRLCKETVEEIFGQNCLTEKPWNCGTSDLGDISCLMPTIHPYMGGAEGTAHGADYYITDPVKACVNPAKMLSGMTVKLLEDGGKLGNKIVSEYQPVFRNKQDYFQAIDGIKMKKQTVIYHDDGKITLDYKNGQAENCRKETK